VSAHYVRPNISKNARDRTAAFFKVLSMLAEIFVFIYIGTSFSTNIDAWRSLYTWTTLVRGLSTAALVDSARCGPSCLGLLTCLRQAAVLLGPSCHDRKTGPLLVAIQQNPCQPVRMQGVVLVALALSRAMNIYPNATVVNLLRPPEMKISQPQQFMIWFSGMRGAMAFAMSLRMLDDMPGAAPPCTCTQIPRKPWPCWGNLMQPDVHHHCESCNHVPDW
jgi:NhaP-type Na+/H+ or K+/H+ antiporter